jgi:hypothetical protein
VPLAGLAVQFYGHPRLALLVIAGDDERRTKPRWRVSSTWAPTWRPSGGLKLRLSTTLGRFEALGLGVAIPWGRGVAVR